MTGRTLFLYFSRRYLMMIVWYLLAVLTLVVVIDYSQISGQFGSLPGFTNLLAFKIAALKSPGILQQLLPFMALFAAMTVLVQLNRKYELVVARASGLSAWQFLFPLTCAAFLVGLIGIVVINPLASKTLALAEELRAGMLNETSGKSAGLSVPWIRQNNQNESVIIGAKSLLRDGSVLASPVFFVLSKDGKLIRRIDADEAVLGDRKWRLINAVETDENNARSSKPEMEIATSLTPELVQERLQDPETIPFFELSHKITVARALGYPAYTFSMQLQSTLALPALCVVMTLIASTVTLKFVRFGQSLQMILGGVLAGFVLYVVTVLVKAFGGAGIVPPVVAAWFPVGLAFLFGISFLLHTEDG